MRRFEKYSSIKWKKFKIILNREKKEYVVHMHAEKISVTEIYICNNKGKITSEIKIKFLKFFDDLS